jgi:hypothetical protein
VVTKRSREQALVVAEFVFAVAVRVRRVEHGHARAKSGPNRIERHSLITGLIR